MRDILHELIRLRQYYCLHVDNDEVEAISLDGNTLSINGVTYDTRDVAEVRTLLGRMYITHYFSNVYCDEIFGWKLMMMGAHANN